MADVDFSCDRFDYQPLSLEAFPNQTEEVIKTIVQCSGMAKPEAKEESHSRLLVLAYSILLISVVSAAFAYVSSTQQATAFVFAYVGLSAIALMIFILIRRHVASMTKASSRKDAET